jgi:hypothetical protein
MLKPEWLTDERIDAIVRDIRAGTDPHYHLCIFVPQNDAQLRSLQAALKQAGINLDGGFVLQADLTLTSQRYELWDYAKDVAIDRRIAWLLSLKESDTIQPASQLPCFARVPY